MNRIKRLLAINDLSCVGRCSLTVALPIVSGAGIECAVLPTAVLSTHTGGFFGYTVKDLEDQMLPIANHWKKENITFDAISSGYLASASQVDKVKKIIDDFRGEKTIVIVDPTMADGGRLYPAFNDSFPEEMKKLVSCSDVCIPNLTEACLLTGVSYFDKVMDKEYFIDIMKKLNAIGAKSVVLTGIKLEEGKISIGVYENGNAQFYSEEMLPYSFHGTGDVFGAIFASAVVLSNSYYDSAVLAAKLTSKAMKETIKTSADSKFGVDFELIIKDLYSALRRGNE